MMTTKVARFLKMPQLLKPAANLLMPLIFSSVVWSGCSQAASPQVDGPASDLLSDTSITSVVDDSVDSTGIATLKPTEKNAPATANNWTELHHPRYLMGKFTAKEHPDFQVVPKAWTDGDGTYHLHARTVEAFGKMREAALKDDVRLTIVSAFRNFSRQKAIWEAKWEGRRVLEGKINAALAYPAAADRARAILRYSSMPGSSRHHWGTDLDLNRLTNGYFESGEGLKVYNWLSANAAEYGFCQPYTAKGDERPNGYEEEKWHWSYVPLSGPLTNYAAANLRDTMISGFAGAKSVVEVEVVENYVLGINSDCR